MWRDPIVEEVRKTREEIFARFDYDLSRYVAFLRAQEAKAETVEGEPKAETTKRAQTTKPKSKARKPDKKGRRAA